MEQKRPNLFVRIVRALWNTVDFSRRFVVNALFLLIVVLLLGAIGSGRPRVPAKAALVIDPEGVLVEQLTGDSLERALREFENQPEPETLMRDLLDAIAAAKDDKQIAAIQLDLDRLEGGGFSKLRQLRAALADFQSAGKKVIASADAFGTASYHLATAADEVHLNPQGLVLIEGFGIWRPYYKEGLDKAEIDWNVFRVGEYKSAVEPYLRNEPSPEAKEEYLDVLGDLWGAYVDDVAEARKMPREAVLAAIDELNPRLRAAGGDFAKAALASRLVDKLSTRDEVRARLIELVGEEEDGHSFARIGFADYLKAKGLRGPKLPVAGDRVGVIVAKGEILDGEQSPGTIGGDSTAALVRKARHDDAVKAIVLRVDSPGGSGFASEIIRRELALARADGKPVVVSMGSLAASGGYWISTASDEIWAEPQTITGSIGIFGMFPTFQKPLAKYLGVHVEGVGTTKLSGALRLDRALAPEVGEAIQLLIEDGYRDFLERVAEARDKTPEEVDRIGRGRIWSGADALKLGLVDQLGGLEQAIAAAAKHAKLEGKPKVQYLEKELTWKEQVFADLFSATARWLPLERASAPRGLAVGARLAALERQLERLARWNDPNGLYAHCLCEVE